MKKVISKAAVLLLAVVFCAMAGIGHAGSVEEVKEGSKKAAQDIKEGAIETGKAVVETGKEVKEGSQKAWQDVKEGAKEVGKEFKKAYEDTRDAIKKEIVGDNTPAEDSSPKAGAATEKKAQEQTAPK